MHSPAIAAPSESRPFPAGSPASEVAAARSRIAVIDVLRGLVMLIMLFYPCRAFARFKRTSKQAWVRYF